MDNNYYYNIDLAWVTGLFWKWTNESVVFTNDTIYLEFWGGYHIYVKYKNGKQEIIGKCGPDIKDLTSLNNSWYVVRKSLVGIKKSE